jgi:hypothetical protein
VCAGRGSGKEYGGCPPSCAADLGFLSRTEKATDHGVVLSIGNAGEEARLQTTNLFVELVVIGIGGALWLGLTVLTIFGYSWVPIEELTSLPGLIPALAVIYLLGILIDRVADGVFEPVTKRLASQVFPSHDEYERARNLVYASEALRNLAEYSRSRMRICRGWILNSALTAVSLNAFIWVVLPRDLPRLRLTMVGTLILLFIGSTALYSWHQLLATYYKRMAQQSSILGQNANGAT